MKKLLILLSVLALSCASGHAQTNTNTVVTPFNVTPPAGTTGTVTVTQTVTSLTVLNIIIDPVNQRLAIRFKELPKPVIIQGADFVTFQTTFQGQFAAAIAAYLAAHPAQ